MSLQKYMPAYIVVAESIKNDITTGQLKYGQTIPSETDLAIKFQVALGTVRRAIQVLVEEKLLIRRQGVGTFVAKANFDKSMFNFFRFHKNLDKQTILEGRVLEKKVITATAEICKNMGLNINDKVIYITRLRLYQDTPVQYENIYLPYDKFTPLMDIKNQDFQSLLYPMYEQLTGCIVASAQEDVSVTVADTYLSNILQLAFEAPLIHLSRVSYDYAGHILEWRYCWGDVQNFQYSIKI